jgi:polyhydroxyalkanoic acid synthase PhaR subunit
MSDKPDFVPTPADFFGWLNRVMSMPMQAASGLPQTPPNLADPLEMWKSFMNQSEQFWGNFMRQTTASREFGETLGRTSGTTAAYRIMLKKATKAYLEAADMPSRTDLTQIARQLVMLDAKVDDANETLGDSLEASHQLLKRIASQLENLAGRVEQLEAKAAAPQEDGNLSERLAALEAQLNRIESALNRPIPIEPATAGPEETKPKPARLSRAGKAKTGA